MFLDRRNTHSCIHLPGIPSSKYLERGDILKIISQASECDLTTSGNAAYMRLELSLAHVTNEKTQQEALKRFIGGGSHSPAITVADDRVRLSHGLYFSDSICVFSTVGEINDKLSSCTYELPSRSLERPTQTWSPLPITKDPPPAA